MSIWSLYPAKDYSQELLAMAGQDTLLARLLVNRGVDSAEAAKYFLSIGSVQESNPLEIPEMNQAFERVKNAIHDKERILVFGDYDVDGTSSVALLYRAFLMIGIEIEFYVPSRHSEGYGLNKDALTKFKDDGINLVITCDCGISNYEEVEYANSIGLDLIVTDHHSIPENPPPSVANCNPKTLPEDHPLHYLPGVGVAYKLAQLILQEFSTDHRLLSRSLLDLVALGMVADMAPLLAENRYLTIEGLKVLANTEKPGLRELMRISGLRVDSADPCEEGIGFGLAPRINAAGRLADATRAVRLMITEDAVEANKLCHELDAENRERQILCNETYEEALSLLDQDRSMLEDNVIVLAKEGWHHGVIGIVASRLLETFHLPVFIMAIEDDKARGSVRCINVPGLDIYEEMKKIQDAFSSNQFPESSDARLASPEQAELTGASMMTAKDERNAADEALGADSLFMKFGGHRMAAGFSVSVSRLDALKSALRQHFRSRLADENTDKLFKIDAALRLSELDLNFINRLSKLAPYGIDNPQAKFVSGPLKIKRMKSLGQDGKHLKLFLTENINGKETRPYEAVIWGRAEEFLESFPMHSQGAVSIVYTPKLNNFMGETSIQLDIRDWKKPEETPAELFFRFNKEMIRT